MICAYDRIYLEKARISLGRMLDFAVYDLKYDITIFFDMFITSGLSEQFEKGESEIIVGKSGVELAYAVLEMSDVDIKRISPRYASGRSKEYWTGWALAYYQWKTALSFENIIKYISIKKLCHYTCHTMKWIFASS